MAKKTMKQVAAGLYLDNVKAACADLHDEKKGEIVSGKVGEHGVSVEADGTVTITACSANDVSRITTLLRTMWRVARPDGGPLLAINGTREVAITLDEIVGTAAVDRHEFERVLRAVFGGI